LPHFRNTAARAAVEDPKEVEESLTVVEVQLMLLAEMHLTQVATAAVHGEILGPSWLAMDRVPAMVRDLEYSRLESQHRLLYRDRSSLAAMEI
jgi:hypothetical protein